MKINEMKEMYAFCTQCDYCPRHCKYGAICDDLFNHTMKRVWAFVPDSLHKAMDELGYLDSDNVSRETFDIFKEYPEYIKHAFDSPEDAFKFWGATMYLYINDVIGELTTDLSYDMVVPYLDSVIHLKEDSDHDE